ncbi:DEAD/DEAH box helicase [Vulcanisaeta distributa]|nr:DEAD/DEAH box helicase [Vulcanisaeta distributa]
MSNFWREHLHPRLVDVIEGFGYLEPTPVQERAIPRVLSGVNVLITAPTGSGKTEAAMFPIMSKILSEGLTGGVAAIYITPARALNRDVNIRLREIASRLGITTAVRHGDTPESERRRQVREPPTILITTPETLQVILVMRSMRRALRNVRWVVVDELHELMNDERGAQLSIALERLVNIAGEYQRIGLSATIGNTELAGQFLAGVGRWVEVVSVDVSREMEISVEYPEASEEDVGLAEELSTMPEVAARVRRIAEIVSGHRATLVFTNTRDEAELLGHRLGRVLGSNAVGVYHGSLDREEREGLEEGLRGGRVRAVVTTSSLELGIDIGHVDAVIQYSSPRQVTKLIQRVGRSGHRLGRRAIGHVITRDTDDYLESLVIARRALNNELEREVEYHEKALDVLHHQVAGMVIEAKVEGRALTVGDVLDTVRRAHPYRGLTRDELMEVLRFMEGNRLIRVNEDGTITPRRGLHRYYFENISMIPDQKHYRARDMITNRAIGELDEEFVETVEPGTQIILAGRPWRIVGIDRGKSEVVLEPLNQVLNAVPTWIGEEIPVPTEVAQEVCRLREELMKAVANGEDPTPVLTKYPAGGAPTPLIEELRQQVSTGVMGFPDTVTIEWRGRDFVIHACLGTKGNQALALYLARYIGQRYRVAVTYVTDPYRALITTPISIPPQAITEALNQSPDYVEGELREAVRSTRLYKYRFIHVARRFGVLPRESVDVNIERLAAALRDTVVDREVIREILTEKINPTPLRQLINSIREGKTAVRIIKVEQYTPIAQHIINQAAKIDAAVQGIPTTTILQLLKKRIEEREVTLLCLNCGWHVTMKVKYVPEQVKCPRCGMRQIAVLKYGEDPARTYEIVRKARRNQRLTREEQEKWQELTQTALAVLQYGKKAIIALAAHGVGPTTAIRKVLPKAKTEQELYQQILEAERQYQKTKPFWNE